MADVTTKFIEELTKLFHVPEGKITLETQFGKDLYTTSLHYYGMMATISKLTGVRVTYPQVHACKTVGDVVNLMNSLKK